MRMLVSAGRLVTFITATVVVLGFIGLGALSGEHLGIGTLVGAALGALLGILVAGSAFGALAALFQIVRLMERADERATAYFSVQVETLGQIADTSARAASALERAQRVAAP